MNDLRHCFLDRKEIWRSINSMSIENSLPYKGNTYIIIIDQCFIAEIIKCA